MKQAQVSYNQRTGRGYVNSNYKGDIFEEFQRAAHNCHIDEILAAYANLNKKQGVTREQLM